MTEDPQICLLTDAFPPVIDGVSTVVLSYAACLHERTGRVVVGAPRYPGARDSYPFPVVRVPSVNLPKFMGYRAGLPYDRATLRGLTNPPPDVIHTHSPFSAAVLARRLRGACGAPVVFTYHTKFDIDIANTFDTELMRMTATSFMLANIEACDEVWAVSRGAGENLKGVGYSGDYLVMENGVDLPGERAPQAWQDALSRRHGLRPGVPVFLFVGRMLWYKGLRVILDGLFRARAAGADFHMLFVGGGGDFDAARAYADMLGLSRQCVFVGSVKDRELLRAYYSRADALLFPSSFDTNGLVVREAAACSRAGVLLRGSAAAEGVTDGADGLLIEDSGEDLARAVLLLARERGFAEKLGKAARETLYISWDSAIQKAREQYAILLDRRRSAPPRTASRPPPRRGRG